jgi:hypothetical protein
LVFSLSLFSCKQNQPETLFTLLTSDATGLNFNNELKSTPQFNMFKYMYFYNGAGVGAGDFNNDGLTDLFFTSNQQQNKLFINNGSLKFEDKTTEASIPNDGGWSTGVSVVDINNDGLLDIYVCRVGQYEILKGKNQLLICKEIKNGVPVFVDEAANYGLDFSGFSTQAAFFDYDLDGDLDLYLMNHSVHHNGTFGPRDNFLNTYHPLSGDQFYKNEKGTYINFTKQTGINSSAIGYGLGICVSDINLDGWPDLYIGNDFHENDYLYINQKNGTFNDELTSSIMHTSQFSMGVDIADINNDAFPEIISMDMLPQDPYILKRSLGEDEYETFKMKIRYGYNYQYARNCLQLNRGNGMFSEIGMYAGVYATDWSWAPLWLDFDNDGNKDLFISNGIPKRLNDIDYVSYVGDDLIQQKIREGSLGKNEMTVIDKFPQIKLANKFFRNKGDAKFEDMSTSIENDLPTYSNGTVYADFDNDGDLDVVVNNIDEDVMLYQNRINDKSNQKFLRISLKGDSNNRNAIGTKIILFDSLNKIQIYDKCPVRGFQSSMETPLHIGVNHLKIDSAFIVWPDNSYEVIVLSNQKNIQLTYKAGLPQFKYTQFLTFDSRNILQMKNVTNATGLIYFHEENQFNEFNREYLLPQMLSTEGPALATGDVNGDGLEDVFIGSSKTKKPGLFVQTNTGTFVRSIQPALDADSTFEETDALIIDVNKDGFNDLVLADGGNEYYGNNEFQLSRVFLNDGMGTFYKFENAIPGVFATASCIAAYDFTGDGFVDLFLGSRTEVWSYGTVPQSYLLANDGKGKFKDVTTQYNKNLQTAGMITDAVWMDMDKDGKKDLVISLQWGGIDWYKNANGKLEKQTITNKKGWWNFILPFDADGDGDMDLMAGNLGLNSRLTASEQQPVKMYVNDFDGNGNKEQLLTYFLNNRELLFANKAELEKQLPSIKKKFLYAADFAKASLSDVIPAKKLKEAIKYTADYFSNTIFINDGKQNFIAVPLPWQAQLTNYRTAAIINANNDALPDLLLGGNFEDNNIQMGRYDADFGTVLLNKGNGVFETTFINGLVIKGQVSHIAPILVGKKQSYLFARNNDSLMVLQKLY